MNEAYRMMYEIALPLLGVAMVACLIRAIMGPRVADRIIAINMTGSIVIIIVCILSFVMNEGYLTDVAQVYALLSFLSVVLLTKIYIGVYLGRRQKKQQTVKEAKEQ